MSRIPSTINVYDNYDCGELTAVDTTGETVTPVKKLAQLLIYPLADVKLSLNGVDKWIFIPAESWTPISILCNEFVVKAISSAADIYWQGWY